jgi:WD40 repeat protein
VTAATTHLFPISASLKDAQGLAPPHYVCDRQLAFDSGNLAPLGLFFLHGVSQLVSWNDREITVWEADSGRQLRSIKVAGKMSFFEISHDLQWATKWDDEKPALSKTDWTAWTQIGHEQSDFKMTGRFVGFNRDLDAIILAIKDDPDRMEFRDLRVGKELRKWENVLVENLIEGPDKQWMITRDYGGGVDVRDADTGKVSRLMATRVDQIVLSPDSRLLAARNLDSIQFFGIRDTSRGLNIPAPDGPYRTNSYRAWFLDLVFTPDNRYLISANNPDVFIWSIATGEQIQHLKFPDLAGGVVQFHILAISDDGHWFAVNYHHGITLCRLDK